MSKTAWKLAEQLRQTKRQSPQDVLPLIEQAEQLVVTSAEPHIRDVCLRVVANRHQPGRGSAAGQVRRPRTRHLMLLLQ